MLSGPDPRLLERELGLALLLGLDARAEHLLEEAFAHQTVDDAVVDDLLEVEGAEVGGNLGIRLLLEQSP